MKILNVAIVGGTHGNELTGAYLVQRWSAYPDAIIRPSFKTQLFLANPKGGMAPTIAKSSHKAERFTVVELQPPENRPFRKSTN